MSLSLLPTLLLLALTLSLSHSLTHMGDLGAQGRERLGGGGGVWVAWHGCVRQWLATTYQTVTFYCGAGD